MKNEEDIDETSIKSPKDQMIHALELVNSNKFEEAIKAFDLLIATADQPEFKSDALFQKGITLSNMGLFPEAIDAFEKSLDMELIKNKSKNAEILVKIGEAHLALKEIKNSKKYFKEAIQLDPNNISAALNIAKILGHEKKFDKANEFCNRIVDEDKNQGEAWYLKGLCMKEIGLFNGSITSFNMALELLENKSDVYNQLGLLYFEMNSESEAYDYFLKATTYDRSNALAWYNRSCLGAELFYKKGKSIKDTKKSFDYMIKGTLTIALNLDPELIGSALKETIFIKIVDDFKSKKLNNLEDFFPQGLILKMIPDFYKKMSSDKKKLLEDGKNNEWVQYLEDDAEEQLENSIKNKD